MKKIKQQFFHLILLLSLGLFTAQKTQAQAFVEDEEVIGLDSAVSLGFLGSLLPSNEDYGSRIGAKIGFNRLGKNVSLDLRMSSAEDYLDFGGVFRVFHHWYSNQPYSSGLSLGLGIGVMYSEEFKEIPSGLSSSVATPANFLDDSFFFDVLTGPFIRYIWDFGNNWGLYLEAEYLINVARKINDDSLLGAADPDKADYLHRFNFGLGLMVEI